MSIISPEVDISTWLDGFANSLKNPDTLQLFLGDLERIFECIISNGILPNNIPLEADKFVKLFISNILKRILGCSKVPEQLLLVYSKIIFLFTSFSRVLLSKPSLPIIDSLIAVFEKQNMIYRANSQFFEQFCSFFGSSPAFTYFSSLLSSELPSIDAMSSYAKIYFSCVKYSDQFNNFLNVVQSMTKRVKILVLGYFDPQILVNMFVEMISFAYQNKFDIDEIFTEWILIFLEGFKSEIFNFRFYSCSLFASLFKNSNFCEKTINVLNSLPESQNIYTIPFHPAYLSNLKYIYHNMAKYNAVTQKEIELFWSSSHIQNQIDFLEIVGYFAKFYDEEFNIVITDLLFNMPERNYEWFQFIKNMTILMKQRNFSILDRYLFELDKLIEQPNPLQKIASEYRPLFVALKINEEQFASSINAFIELLNSDQCTEFNFNCMYEMCRLYRTNDENLINSLVNKLNSKHSEEIRKLLSCIIIGNKIKLNNQQIINVLSSTNEDHENLVLIQDLIKENLISHVQILQNANLVESNSEVFYQIIKEAIYSTNDGCQKVLFPFKGEYLLWDLAIKKTNLMKQFQKLLCRIYSRNVCDDEIMVQEFLINWLQIFDKSSPNDSCFLLLLKFINKIESSIPSCFIRFSSLDKMNTIKIRFSGATNIKEVITDRTQTISQLISKVSPKRTIVLEHNNNILDMKTIIKTLGDDLELVVHSKQAPNVRERTCFPSLYISRMNRLMEIFYSCLVEKLPSCFTLMQLLPVYDQIVEPIKTLNFELSDVFPFNTVHKFAYNLIYFISVYDKSMNQKIVEMGLIDYFISVGLSTASEFVISRVLLFFDMYFEEEINIPILYDQLVEIIRSFIPNNNNSCSILLSIFKLGPKLKGMKLSKEIIKDLILHNNYELRNEFAKFLKNIVVEQEILLQIYNDEEYEPSSSFYEALADHFPDDPSPELISVIISNLKNKKKFTVHDANCVLKMMSINSEKLEKIGKLGEMIMNRIKTSLKNRDISIILWKSLFKYKASNTLLLEFLPRIDFGFNSYYMKGDDIKFCQRNKQVGLLNLGATCYANSVIQQLVNIPNFMIDLFKIENPNDFIQKFKKMAIRLQYSNKEYLNPKKLLQMYDQSINLNEQRDAVEFLQFFLERLGLETFNFDMITKIESIDKANEFCKTDHYSVLPLDIEGFSKLNDSFQYLMRKNALPDGFKFNDTEGVIEANQVTRFHNMKSQFILQLKRFKYNYNSQKREKINSRVNFTETINFYGKKYILNGFIMHQGSSQSGHYYSYIKNGNIWVCYNDSDVKTVDNPIELGFGNGNSSAYLLFYVLADDSKFEPPQEVYKAIMQKNTYREMCSFVLSSQFYNQMLIASYSQDPSLIFVCIKYFFNVLFAYTEDTTKMGMNLIDKMNSVPNLYLEMLSHFSELKLFDPLIYSPRKLYRKCISEILKAYFTKIEPNDEIPRLLSCFKCLKSSPRELNELFDVLLFIVQAYPNVCQAIKEKSPQKEIEAFFCSLKLEKPESYNFNEILSFLTIMEPSLEFLDYLIDEAFLSFLLSTETEINIIANLFMRFPDREMIKSIISAFEEENTMFAKLNDLIVIDLVKVINPS